MSSKFCVIIDWPDRKYQAWACDAWTETIRGLSYKDAGAIESMIRREYRGRFTSVRVERERTRVLTQQAVGKEGGE